MLSTHKIIYYGKTVLVLLFVCILLPSKFLGQTTWYVNDNATTGDIYCSAVGSGGTTSATGSLTAAGKGTNPFLTLSAAIAVAASGDIILVDAGTYSDKTITLTKNITIQGAGIGITIFKVTTNNNYFMYVNSNSTLADFTITGYGDPNNGLGQAITVNSGSSNTSYSVTLNALSIYNCGAAQGYASILINKNSKVNITQGSTTCSWASGSAAGGIDVVGTNCNVLISNYLFFGNWKYAYNTISQGGALSITGANSTTTVTVSQTNFTSNEVNNGSDGWGGAIYQTSGNLYVYDCLFNSNKVYNNSGNTYGEAIAITGGSASISGSKFSSNQNDNGGSNNYGGAIYATGTTTVSIDSCSFTGNSADATRGLDIYAASVSNFTVNNSSFASVASSDIVALTSLVTVTNSGTPTHSGSTINISGGSFTPVAPTVLTYSGTCATTIIVLPISLTQFQGQCVNNQITLVWQTATETNNRVFNIERSTDGINFTVIGTVNGAGNSTHSINYTFIDKTAERSSYYRLSQVDYNGNSSRSAIIYVERNCSPKTVSDISLFPNPATSQVTLNLTIFQTANISLEIYNSIGLLVKQIPVQTLEAGIQTIDVDIAGLAAGAYFFKNTVNNQVFISRFIKQ